MRKVIAYAAISLLALVGCRTTETSNSETASYRPSVPPVDDNTDAGGGQDGSGTDNCGRDGGAPFCGAGRVCVQATGGSEQGTCFADPVAGTRPQGASLLKNLSVKPANGGINPSYKGITVSANVMTGSNACEAKGYKADLQLVVKDNGGEKVTHVWPTAKVTGSTNSVCTKEFKPQYTKVSKTLAGLKDGRDRVIVHGISDKGGPSKLVFGTQCPVPACAQPPPGCFMGKPQPELLNESGCSMLPCGILQCQKNQCPNGRMVDIGTDPKSGCPRDPVCVDDSTCPQLSPPPPGWCSGGTIIPRGPDDRGCSRAPACLTQNSPCPQLSPPPPNWCDDGKIVSGGVDTNGCVRPPHCVRDGDCS